MVEKIKYVFNKFDIDGVLYDVNVKTTGNINNTYIGTFKMNNGQTKKYVLQRINSSVFVNPHNVMKNITNVTSWMKKKSVSNNIQFLDVISTKNADSMLVISTSEGEEYYRVFNYIENSISYDNSKDENVIYNAGKAFGNFQKLLIDYPVDTIEDVIVDFHNTKKRYIDFLNDIEKNVANRVKEVFNEIDFVQRNSNISSIIVDLLDEGKIKERVIHGDTKINNVMFDKLSGNFLTVIDLDTIMRGSSLYDYGDGVRAAAASAFEDEINLDKVYLNTKLFESFTDGYLSEIGTHLDYEEILNMATSIEVITYELGLRFLNDYINGDVYFKTTMEKHNLIRARNQFKLLKDIQSKRQYMNDFILKKYDENIKRLKLNL